MMISLVEILVNQLTTPSSSQYIISGMDVKLLLLLLHPTVEYECNCQLLPV